MTDTKTDDSTTDEEKTVSPFSRFRDIIPGKELAELEVTIIGAGGIGAPLALSLAKMGVKKMHIWDADVVNEENMGPQRYGPRHPRRLKDDRPQNWLRGQAPWCTVTVNKEFYTEASSNNSEVVITALDSLAARKGVWKTIDPDVCKLFVDPRMGAEVLTILSVVPKEDSEWYAPTLEGEALEVKCTAKSTFHCGFIAGALAAREVKAWLVGERTLVAYSVCLRFMTLLGDDQEVGPKRHADEIAAAAE